jgi:hypothetical protein
VLAEEPGNTVPGSLNIKGGKRCNLGSIFCHSAFLGSLVKDGILSSGGRKAGRNCNLKKEDFPPLFFTVTNCQQIKITN